MNATHSAPKHHPDEATLLDYAAGSLREALAVAVATHLWYCRACRDAVRETESVGGALLEQLVPDAANEAALASVLARLDHVSAAVTAPAHDATKFGDVPGPLRPYLTQGFAELAWQRKTASLATVELVTNTATFRTRLLRIAAGAAMPRHTHRGAEFTVVLKGGYADELGRFGPGDVAATDPTIVHQPVADRGSDCICLAVTDAPVRLVGALGLLLNPFVRF